jgi:hypothetical protein
MLTNEMKRTIPLAFLLLLLFCGPFFVSCKVAGYDATQKVDEFEKMSWLLGSWNNASNGMSLTETWTKASDTLYLGKSIALMGADTIFNESIRLETRMANIFFTTTSVLQGHPRTFSYRMTKNSASSCTFENSSVIEQSLITYEVQKDGSLQLILCGKDDDGPVKETYLLKKAE